MVVSHFSDRTEFQRVLAVINRTRSKMCDCTEGDASFLIAEPVSIPRSVYEQNLSLGFCAPGAAGIGDITTGFFDTLADSDSSDGGPTQEEDLAAIDSSPIIPINSGDQNYLI
jgi:hypothetical protein